jgi:hypothetical protein
MAAPAPKYQPNWIGRAEALVIMLEVAELDLGPAGRWLEYAKQDRPPVPLAEADPVRDLFRISPLAVLNDDGIVGLPMRPGRLNFSWGRGWESIEISHSLLVGLLPKKAEAKHKGGAPEALDWIAIEDAVRLRVKELGWPDLENPKGWRRKADVEQFVTNIISERGESAAPSTIRTHVTAILNGIKSAGN